MVCKAARCPNVPGTIQLSEIIVFYLDNASSVSGSSPLSSSDHVDV